LWFVDKYEKDIETLARLNDWKARQLILAGNFFVIGTVFSALNLILATVLK
jgi:hypothetical protein